MKVDQCQHCTVRGDLDACQKTPCNQHESWYAMTMQAEIARLRAFVMEAIDMMSLSRAQRDRWLGKLAALGETK